ncbi:unnamed protein product [Polarella glacialis]|uniref:Ribose-5-phosphate isomerase n=1 Tax=Polarella glacialis TaxID=89957 RepID=A0A813F5H1_POLGL|nr:unnamed protein product [Polarella glacialis]
MKRALSQDDLKRMVGYQAVDDYVKSGTVIGLGTGSTAAHAVDRVGEKLKSGELKDIIAIPTSVRTKEQAEKLGILVTVRVIYYYVVVSCCCFVKFIFILRPKCI